MCSIAAGIHATSEVHRPPPLHLTLNVATCPCSPLAWNPAARERHVLSYTYNYIYGHQRQDGKSHDTSCRRARADRHHLCYPHMPRRGVSSHARHVRPARRAASLMCRPLYPLSSSFRSEPQPQPQERFAGDGLGCSPFDMRSEMAVSSESIRFAISFTVESAPFCSRVVG